MRGSKKLQLNAIQAFQTPESWSGDEDVNVNAARAKGRLSSEPTRTAT